MARSPLSQYQKGAGGGSHVTRRRITRATYWPSWMAGFGNYVSRIADGENFGMTGHREIGVDDDFPGFVHRRAQPSAHRRRQHARAPQHRSGADAYPAG